MKKEQGIAPLIIVAVVAVVAVAGFFLLKKTGKSPSTMMPSTVSLNPNCKYNDPDLCKYVNRTLSGDYFSKPMVMKSTTKDKTGKAVSEMSMEMEGPKKVHMVMIQGGKEFMNTVTINDTIYMKDQKDGKWWKQSLKDATPQQGQTKQFTPEEFKKDLEGGDKTTFKKVGKETCGNLTCFKYQLIYPGLESITQYVYFDDKEYMMRKTVTITKTGETTEMTFELGGSGVTAPSPTKDVPAGQNIYMMGIMGGSMMEDTTKTKTGGGNAPSQEEVNKMMEQLQQKYGKPQ